MKLDATNTRNGNGKRLRVALFSRYPLDANHPHGGVESVAVVLVRALARLPELDVHVLTLEAQRQAPAVESHDGATVHRLPGSNWPQMADILIGPGQRRLLQYLRELRPDVIHTHETYGLTLPKLAVPHVFTIHGFDHANLVADSARLARIRSWIWRRIERFGLARRQHIISISPYVRRMLEPLTRATIYDIDNPVDERFFAVPRAPQAGRILCVGWINHRKNTLGAVQALARMRDLGVAGTLVIAGKPHEQAYADRVRAHIRESGLDAQVEFLGHIDHGQLQRELGRAAVFLLPSRQENSPMAIAEAMAVGVPVIASNRCGMPYMVSEGESGYLIDPENTQQIADRLAKTLHDLEQGEVLGATGREIALRRFHPDAVARRTAEVYHQLAGPRIADGTRNVTMVKGH